MKGLGRAIGAWILVLSLGIVVASCATRMGRQNLRVDITHQEFATITKPDTATQVKVQTTYGKLPLHFEANQGQTDEQVKFLSRGKGYTLFLTPTEAVLTLHRPESKAKGKKQRAKGKREEQEKTVGATMRMKLVGANPQPQKNSLAPASGERARVRGSNLEPTQQTILRMELLGANPNPQVIGLEELPGKSNYFIGNDPSKWRTGISHYAKVKYKEIYPGVDLVYYGDQRQLEYDFVIAPGADPNVIQFAFEGLVGRSQGSPLQIDDSGDLILHTDDGEVRLRKPLIYQETNGIKQPIPGGYVLPSPQFSSLVTFHVAAYDTSKPLIIDPVLSYSTYLGGSGNDLGWGITVDSSGNAYVGGETQSTDFPTASPFQAAYGGGTYDVFVTKLNAAGSAFVYSTYLGGSSGDQGHGIVAGYTTSTDFPTTIGAFQTTYGGIGDAFVANIVEEESLSVSTTSLAFGEVVVGSTQDLTFTIQNIGEDALSGTLAEGPSVELSDSTSPTPFFRAPLQSNGSVVLSFELTVNDGQNDSLPDTVAIIVQGLRP